MNSKRYKIIDSLWWSNLTGQAGVVAIETSRYDQGPLRVVEWKAFIGVGIGLIQSADEQHVAAWGSGLLPREATGFFPGLDIARYKKEEAEPVPPPSGEE